MTTGSQLERGPLNRRVRTVLRLHALLTRVGALPDHATLLAKPESERTALGTAGALVGPVPAVPHEDHTVRTRDGQGIRVRVYRPEHQTRQPLLYVHGGGFVVGGVDACDHVCRRLADSSGAVVASVEHRLAPEHPYPVPLQDCADAAQWFRDRADSLGVDPDLLVVGGDSAGGNLAAALAVQARDQGQPLAGQLLIYPAVDLSLSLPGVSAYDSVGLSTADVRLLADSYLAGADATDPYASPWYADATGLAPAFVLTVGHDPLHGEGLAYAEKLRDAGVPVQHLHRSDHVHGSLSLPRLFDGVDEVYDAMTAFLRSRASGG